MTLDSRMPSGIYDKNGRMVIVFGGSIGMAHVFDEKGHQFLLMTDIGRDAVQGDSLAEEDIDKVMDAPVALVFQSTKDIDVLIEILQSIKANL